MASPGIHSCWMAAINSVGWAVAAVALSANAAQIDIPGPLGSGAFGTSVTVLPNGNFVVVDPSGPVSNIGAVYLYDPGGNLISTLTGSSPNDQVGSGGVTVLSNGHFVVSSPNWDNGGAQNAGAVTWVHGTLGFNGLVSPANSLVGTSAGDAVGLGGVTALPNGNYVVASFNWGNFAGASTWANGNTGIAGEVTPANSLVGASSFQFVGGRVTVLSNGNYVVGSEFWDNGVADSAGAATWGNGLSGVSGPVTALNSLVGTSTNDSLGANVVALSNGNYMVASSSWDNTATPDAGAVTWGNGLSGVTGPVSAANSLIGTSTGDFVGTTVTALSNGNYVVGSALWNKGGIQNVGAATWVSGTSGLFGAVTAVNSLVGSKAGDQVAGLGIAALSNGHYVVSSPLWDSGGTQNVGAATWANGTIGLSGAVSPANSLIGTKAGDQVGFGGVRALSNGNYVVCSPLWDNGATQNVGAATWGNGSTGTIDTVAPRNSLRGTTAEDQVGFGATALSNGNYVVRSPFWNNGAIADVGAATWGNGTGGTIGVVSEANSLIGTSTNDLVGFTGVTALSNGNYVVSSQNWRNGGIVGAGAATWANGGAGLVGTVSPANSLVGTTFQDSVGFGIMALSDGNYAFRSSLWDSGGFMNAGAVTLGRGGGGLKGAILPANSVLGTAVAGGNTMVFDYDPAREQLVVGRPASNIVTIFTLPPELVFADGFE